VCAVSLADKDAELRAFLETEFPAAELERDDAGLADWLAALLRHIAGDVPHLDLPLDVRATAFQRRVWEELRKIPRGETRTYQQVAEAIGEPTAARAVARACATNPASVVIPCHRVVGTDGGLRGYRWGLARKKKLLEREQKKD
jgi:AraC family transcriptional regulator of adaptative response/methylated-DNA-[protein]-cysteine methyltransferase